ncbi:hypothetical protein M408DRAFT_328504 [Serendipita vermifera MAFF 305830]|uniref:SHSP domain-containing protein n=1 Tax=Serendipita vermifera MAFF 305830 TaxID=933852 RepID=A0A0C3B031_SERVB|nr:hypothetical protein M408DRAFT_328504 [Serendipita vermifera MAFF 305830]
MVFGRSRSLFHEFSPLFRLLEQNAARHNSQRLAARFAPAAACSAAHVGRSNVWTQGAFNTWGNKFKWDWNWGRDPAYWNAKSGSVRPAMDIVEKSDAYVIEADVPGVKKGEMTIRVADDGWSLVVEGKRAFTGEKAEGKDVREAGDATNVDSLVSERAQSFMRKIWFRQEIDGRGVKAKLEDGVLKLHVPKRVAGDGGLKVDIA